jgi:hypothetical protein
LLFLHAKVKTAMILHVFNPEHDLALASNLRRFTAPRAARHLRTGLGFLPCLWAKEGDAVLVTNREDAQHAFENIQSQANKTTKRDLPKNIQFVAGNQLKHLDITTVDVWGWDLAIRDELLRYGITSNALLSEEKISILRKLSHRQTAAGILPLLRCKGTVGEAIACHSIEEIDAASSMYGSIVLKAPWSCSGRGIRFAGSILYTPLKGWIKNLLNKQGCVMVEPYYNKIKDFGMEFYCHANGEVEYLGLSLFETTNGVYTGNLLATESEKQKYINTFIPAEITNTVRERIKTSCADIYSGRYEGGFGVDMMIVSGRNDREFLLHPCVEINLRRTMGHVALTLSPNDDALRFVMKITTENNYQIKINK